MGLTQKTDLNFGKLTKKMILATVHTQVASDGGGGWGGAVGGGGGGMRRGDKISRFLCQNIWHPVNFCYFFTVYD